MQLVIQLVRAVHDEGQQCVARHVEEVVVVVDNEDDPRHRSDREDFKDFKDFMLTAPGLSELEIDRPRAPAPQVDLSDGAGVVPDSHWPPG